MLLTIKRKNPTPDWLGYLLGILVVLFLVITQCNQDKLTQKFEEKYIYE